MSDFSWADTLALLVSGQDLEEHAAGAAMRSIMSGEATPAQIGAFLIALRAKGETVDEITGLARVMREFSLKVPVTEPVVDTCGTGGDRAGTANISTMAALAVAGAGVKVAKHGNRAASSKCGSADLLEALGVAIDLAPEGVAACIEEASKKQASASASRRCFILRCGTRGRCGRSSASRRCLTSWGR
jgi:anthranilate phosphoribosyltransferase